MGKTTLGEYLKSALIKSNLVQQLFGTDTYKPNDCVVTIEQDSFAPNPDNNNDDNKEIPIKNESGKLCKIAFEELLKSSKYGIIIILRNNSNENQYKDYCKIAKKYFYGSYALYPFCFESGLFNKALKNINLLLLLICLQSVYNRSNNINYKHPTFYSLPISKQLSIVLSFYTVFKSAKLNKFNDILIGSNSIKWIDVVDFFNKETMLKLKPILSILENYILEIRNNPWDHSKYRLDKITNLIKILQLNTNNYQIYRLSSENIAKNIVNVISNKIYIKNLHLTSIERPHFRSLYFGIFWNDETRKYLNKQLELIAIANDIDISFGNKYFNDHITLMVNKDKNDNKNNKNLWNKCIYKWITNPFVKISVTGIAVDISRCITYTVKIEDNEVNELCISGHPHITCMVLPTLKPYISLGILKHINSAIENQYHLGNKYWIKFEPFQFYGEISVKIAYY